MHSPGVPFREQMRERHDHWPHRWPHTLARADRPLPGQSHDRARFDYRECRAALHSRGPRLYSNRAGLGRERLSAHLRRLPAAGWPARRPLRPPAALPHRYRHLHAGLALLWPGAIAGDASRRAGGSGSGRRHRLGGRSLADDEPLHRARRACAGDGLLWLRRRWWWQHRRPARRRPDRRAELALDLPRQSSHRYRGLCRRTARACQRPPDQPILDASTSLARSP